MTSFAPHTWLTEERDAADLEHWFGIYNANGKPKPAGAAYLEAVRLRRFRGSRLTPTDPWSRRGVAATGTRSGPSGSISLDRPCAFASNGVI